METLSDFKKLYGKMYGKINKKTTYQIKIKFNFDAESIGTNKSIIFSEIGNFGDNN